MSTFLVYIISWQENKRDISKSHDIKFKMIKGHYDTCKFLVQWRFVW